MIFKANGTSHRWYELYSASIFGGGATEINAPYLDGQTVATTFGVGTEPFRITSDSQSVVYIEGPQNSGGASRKIYAVPASGGAPTLLDQTFTNEFSTSPRLLTISPTDQDVYYGIDTNTFSGVYRASIEGGQPTQLLSPTVGEIGPYSLSKDGKFIVFPYTEDGHEPLGLTSVSLDTGVLVPLFSPATGSGNVYSHQLSADNQRVVVLRGIAGDLTKGQLTSSLIDGGSVVDLTPAVSKIFDYKISPDGLNVVFRSDYLNAPNFPELFSVPITGGPITKISGPLYQFGTVEWFDFTPDGSKVVYTAKTISNSNREIFQVRTTGGESLRIDSDFGPNLRLDFGQGSVYLISPDGRFLAYRMMNQSTGRQELHLARIIPEPSSLFLGFLATAALLVRRPDIFSGE